ncbi:MAG: hypothetical protein OEO82_07685 [Gammaproteobacteria bacterium]|nr:hypothetical protein [Gammaproteobacteria bacterium]
MIQSPRYSAIIVTLSYDRSAAVVLLPPISGGRLQDARLATWLSRATLGRAAGQQVRLETILAALNLQYPAEGVAALRMWGQTGERPDVWIAAADPVYLEPRLDHLCLHALDSGFVPPADLAALLGYLQAKLAEDAHYGFARIDSWLYVRSTVPMASARLPSCLVDQQLPNEFMPTGAQAGPYRALRSEVEMALHDSELNAQRQARGLPPINSLWLWGGGHAPAQRTAALPPLFAGDALLRGYWLCNTGVVAPWPGSIAACLAASAAGFVAEPDFAADDIDALEDCLHALRAALRTGRLSRLQLIFHDGLEAQVERRDAWRLWRRRAALLA